MLEYAVPLTDGRYLVLASGSVYKRELMMRLGLAFSSYSPAVDETPQVNEAPAGLALRLAQAKARSATAAISTSFSQRPLLTIGCDQVAALSTRSARSGSPLLLSKPGNFDRARRQLSRCAGQRVDFFTALCLIDSRSGRLRSAVERFSVHFRELTKAQIESYLNREQPYDCAGSFKAEGLGITLFDRLEGDDPTGLIGLPLIRLTRLLEAEEVAVL